MSLQPMRLKGLFRIQIQRFVDARGFFSESYQQSRYLEWGLPSLFSQDNLAFSRQGVLRGLHFQSHPGQAKLISVVRGRIWDVAVDCRPDSPTFGQWEALELNDQEPIQFFIPVGFAHGYYALEESFVQYKVSTPYNPITECSLRWNDADLNIAWPVTDPILSERDRVSPFFRSLEFIAEKPPVRLNK